jgi:hypothetical protein
VCGIGANCPLKAALPKVAFPPDSADFPSRGEGRLLGQRYAFFRHRRSDGLTPKNGHSGVYEAGSLLRVERVYLLCSADLPSRSVEDVSEPLAGDGFGFGLDRQLMARQRLAPVRRSTTIIVKALVNPAWLIEIEAVAAARAR